MNLRQQKYRKNRLLGMNPENAALAAGFSRSYARARAHKIDQSAKVGMRDAFEQAGLTDKFLVDYCMKALFAMRPIAADVFIKQEDGKLIAVKNENDWIEVEDWGNRHKFLSSVCEMTERSKLKIEHTGDGLKTIINIVNQYGGNTNPNPDNRLSAAQVAIRSLEPSGAIQDSALAPTGAQDNAGTEQAHQGILPDA
jgi:hypothetical protein